MAREEAKRRVIEDPLTGVDLEVSDGREILSRIRGANGNVLEPNANGSIPVTTVVTPPPASTPIIQEGFSSTNSIAGVDTIYSIPNGEVLHITSLDAGAEFNSAGSVVELFDDINGNLTGMNRISEIYVNANSDEKSVDENFTGDGTRRIVLRRRAFGGGAREISGRWRGYLE